VVVVSNKHVPRGTTIDCKILGMLEMEDEKGDDHKIISIPTEEYVDGVIEDVFDLPRSVLETIRYFFANYKTNELGRWSEVGDYFNRPAAERLVSNSQHPLIHAFYKTSSSK
jgi:inorganic pyrophosphatase